MPRRINKKCVECPQLSTDEAKQVHGEAGDGCWNEDLCHRRRSHYRNRREVNEKRRSLYHQQTSAEVSAGNQVETVSLSVAEESAPYASLYIWREKRKDAP